MALICTSPGWLSYFLSINAIQTIPIFGFNNGNTVEGIELC